jgi:hypothetical protein
MINILKKLSSKLERSTNPFIIIISLFFLFLGKIVFRYKKILDRIINGPKIKYRYDGKYFYKNRKLHRDDDLPAIINYRGDKEWYQNGLLHRDNGPAIETSNGYKAWYQYGEVHRIDGHAIEYTDGAKRWCQNGECHRLDGPAFERRDGYKSWHIEGKKIY